jgi:hypothetical protein
LPTQWPAGNKFFANTMDADASFAPYFSVTREVKKKHLLFSSAARAIQAYRLEASGAASGCQR